MTKCVKTIMEMMPSSLNSLTDIIYKIWTDSKIKSLKLGVNGIGLLLNAEDGVFGDISITTGEEKPGFGLTINQTATVDKFDHTYLLGRRYPDNLFFTILKICSKCINYILIYYLCKFYLLNLFYLFNFLNILNYD